jgi:hypothetical protein
MIGMGKNLLVLMSNRFMWLLAFGLLLSGCASQKNLDQLVQERKLVKQTIDTGRFTHLLIAPNTESASHDVLHIYIEGDGSPWLRKDAIAADPTPHNPLALKLMLQDPTPSIYLGRPCYFGLMNSPNCVPPVWTHLRYSEQVIDSMQAALEKYLQDNAYQHLTFIGYSGGGVIAMLLAKRFPQTNRLVTIAANLDIDAWTRYHNFSALSGSINPATQPPLPWSIQQTHYAGKRDKNVPVAIINYVSSRQPNSKMRTKENFDHICCWEKEWPDLLKELNILPK